MAVRCRRDARCRQCTGKRLSRAIWSSFNKERMSHLCDSTVAGPTARRDNVLASKCEYPPFRYPPFKCALTYLATPLSFLQGNSPAKRDRATRGAAATLTPIALHCATKHNIIPKKPLTLVSNYGCLGFTERGGWRGVGRKGWQRVGERLARGWRGVGEGLAKGWRRF